MRLLARAIQDGDHSARPPLYDLWLECGLSTKIADDHIKGTHWNGCYYEEVCFVITDLCNTQLDCESIVARFH